MRLSFFWGVGENNNSTAARIIDGLLAENHVIIKHCLFGRKFVFGHINGGFTDGES